MYESACIVSATRFANQFIRGTTREQLPPTPVRHSFWGSLAKVWRENYDAYDSGYSDAPSREDYAPAAVIGHDFYDERQAWKWFAITYVYEESAYDNFRFAYVDEAGAVERYTHQRDDGCCGSVDIEVKVGGRVAYMGFNYGH